MKNTQDFPESHATWSGTIDGLECFICPGPMEGLNGYCRFPERPVKEPNYHGLVGYTPVHGGITFASQKPKGMVYGFDTAHCDSDEFPRNDEEWIKGQIAIMIKGLRLAAELEDEYLLAEGDNEKRAVICQKVADLQPDQAMHFGTMINMLSGKL